MTKNISKVNFRSKFSAKILRYLSKFFFKDVRYYLQSGIQATQPIPYPCTIFVNHVEERDILIVGYLPHIFPLRARLYFPIQRDLSEREFPSETKTKWDKLKKILPVSFKTSHYERNAMHCCFI